MPFTRIALQKLNELLQRKKFIKVGDVDDDGITILFEDRICSISPFGNIEWFDHPQK